MLRALPPASGVRARCLLTLLARAMHATTTTMPTSVTARPLCASLCPPAHHSISAPGLLAAAPSFHPEVKPQLSSPGNPVPTQFFFCFKMARVNHCLRAAVISNCLPASPSRGTETDTGVQQANARRGDRAAPASQAKQFRSRRPTGRRVPQLLLLHELVAEGRRVGQSRALAASAGRPGPGRFWVARWASPNQTKRRVADLVTLYGQARTTRRMSRRPPDAIIMRMGLLRSGGRPARAFDLGGRARRWTPHHTERRRRRVLVYFS
jgi:hypothetical protein